MLPEAKVVTRGNTIVVNGKLELVRVSAPSQDKDLSLQFIPSTVTKLNFEVEELKKKFAEGAYTPAADDEWVCL